MEQEHDWLRSIHFYKARVRELEADLQNTLTFLSECDRQGNVRSLAWTQAEEQFKDRAKRVGEGFGALESAMQAYRTAQELGFPSIGNFTVTMIYPPTARRSQTQLTWLDRTSQESARRCRLEAPHGPHVQNAAPRK